MVCSDIRDPQWSAMRRRRSVWRRYLLAFGVLALAPGRAGAQDANENGVPATGPAPQIAAAEELSTIPVAGEAPAPVVPEAEAGAELISEVVVTARMREEVLSEVPESIQAYSGDTLEAAGVGSIRDLTRVTPNFNLVEAQQPGVVLINIRGIGQIRMGEAPIAVIVDGVQANIPNQITADLFDIERMEVLKGPQGSTYGRNAIGGAISIVTRQPTNEFSGSLKGTLGNGEDRRIGAQLSGPIIDDTLLFRVAGKYREFGGLIDGVNLGEKVDDEEAKSARASLKWLATDALSATLTGTYDDIRAGASYYVPYSVFRDIGKDPDINDPKPVIMDHKGLGTRRIEDASLKVDYETAFGTFSSISAYSKLESFLDEDLEWTPLPLLTAIQDVDNKAISQELRFVSDNTGPLNWLAGAYYLETERETLTVPYIAQDLTTVISNLLGAVTGQDIPLLVPFVSKHFTDDNKAYALFAHAGYQITEALDASLGFRYDVDDRHQVSLIDGGVGDATFRSLQPKVSVNYKFGELFGGGLRDLMIYTTVGKGFRSGGFNPSDKVGRQYEKEELWNYEIGFKSRVLERSFLNLALFYTDIRDRQVYTLDLLTVSQLIANPVPDSHVMGLEVEFSTRPLRGLELGVGGGLLESRVDRYNPDIYAGTVAHGDFKGHDLNQVPGYSYNAFVQYGRPVCARCDVELTARADANGAGGDFYWELDNEDRRAPQHFLNLRLTLSGSSWSISAFGENVLEEEYIVEYVPYEFSGGLADLGQIGRAHV
jgi:iron complex outermembrane receptor protein